MKTETESQAIIVREGKLAEDAKESVENRRIFWLMENEKCGIRFRIIDRTPELAISSAESLVKELGKYQAVHALAAYRSDTRIGILKIYSRSSKWPTTTAIVRRHYRRRAAGPAYVDAVSLADCRGADERTESLGKQSRESPRSPSQPFRPFSPRCDSGMSGALICSLKPNNDHESRPQR